MDGSESLSMQASEYEYEQQTWPEQIEFDNLYMYGTLCRLSCHVWF